MSKSAVLEAENAIRSRRRERVANDVGESGHRLRLSEEAIAYVVDAEAVIHVGGSDADLDELAHGHGVRSHHPRPLLRRRIHDHRGGLTRRRVWHLGKGVADHRYEEQYERPEHGTS